MIRRHGEPQVNRDVQLHRALHHDSGLLMHDMFGLQELFFLGGGESKNVSLDTLNCLLLTRHWIQFNSATSKPSR